MPPKRRISNGRGKGTLNKSRTQGSNGLVAGQGKRQRQVRPALDWGDENVEEDGSDSDSDEVGSRESKRKFKEETEKLAEIAEAEARETAEEKRLRLARDVLHRLDAEERDKLDETDEDEDMEGGDYIGEKLAQARLKATGMLHTEVALGLKGKIIAESSIRRMRGHKLTPTCVALSPDDATAFSGSKDNSILRWDVETGQRTVLQSRWRKLPGGGIPEVKAHSNEVLALAVSGDGRFLASGGRDCLVHVWDSRSNTLIASFRGHQDTVSSLTFRSNSLALFSASHDRCVKHWDLNEMGYVETLFGHQSEINAIDACHKERAVTGSQDRTVRLWKVLEDSHLVFRPIGGGTVDCISMLNDEWFVTGGEDGSLSLWFAMKKKPVVHIPQVHGCAPSGTPAWISAVCCKKQSDLVVSGSSDGLLRLWRANVQERSMEQASHGETHIQVSSVPLRGFVNGLSVSSAGTFVMAAVGQEHRLGRWEHQRGARNEVCVVPLPFEEGNYDAEDEDAAAGDSGDSD
ncbi:unnamed protein product [Discosporangium mesarthrocarpum]